MRVSPLQFGAMMIVDLRQFVSDPGGTSGEALRPTAPPRSQGLRGISSQTCGSKRSSVTRTLPGAHLVGLIWPASSAGAGRRILRGVQSARANSDGAYGRRLPRFAGYHRCQCRRAGRLRRTPDATRRDPEVGGRSARRHKRRISTQSLDTGSATQARCRCRRCCTAISGQLGTGSGAGGR